MFGLISSRLFQRSRSFLRIYFFCGAQTKGFRPYSSSPISPMTPAGRPLLYLKEQTDIAALFNQPFTFLGSGGWCYAFLGQDQKTVLKFYRHTHLLPSSIFKDFSFDKLLLKSAPSAAKCLTIFKNSTSTAACCCWKEAKDRSGLLYVHLNKTQELAQARHPDRSYRRPARIDLDKTEFVIQKKADLLIPHLENLLQQQKPEEVKHCLDDLIDCLLTLYKNGIRDNDTSLRQNFGFTDQCAITLDLSSFEWDASLQKAPSYQKEISLKTKRLAHWLKKYHPDLFLYYDARLKALQSETAH